MAGNNSIGLRYKNLTVDKIVVEATIKKVQQLLAEEVHLSSALRAALEVLIVLVQLLANRLSLNSRNSSKPSSTVSTMATKITTTPTKSKAKK